MARRTRMIHLLALLAAAPYPTNGVLRIPRSVGVTNNLKELSGPARVARGTPPRTSPMLGSPGVCRSQREQTLLGAAPGDAASNGRTALIERGVPLSGASKSSATEGSRCWVCICLKCVLVFKIDNITISSVLIRKHLPRVEDVQRIQCSFNSFLNIH